MEFNVIEEFKNPKFVGVVANPDEGKSNLLYLWIKRLINLDNKPNIYVYGLKREIENTNIINSLGELESIENSIIIIDEFIDLIKTDNKNKRESVERTIRLLYHNNNVIVLAGLPENFNKFISSKLSHIIYKKITLDDAIKGSRVSKKAQSYNGEYRGSEILAIPKNKAIVYDGTGYFEIDNIYLEEFDTKKDNPPIIKC